MADVGSAPVEGIRSHRTLALAGRTVLILLVAFLVVWVLFIAHGTTFGSAVHDPTDFLITLLDGITAAALYFVVASGFTLIFGLMRTVNMAHGAFFLFGGYIALTGYPFESGRPVVAAFWRQGRWTVGTMATRPGLEGRGDRRPVGVGLTTRLW